MEKIAVSLVGFCFKGALCGGAGYVLGGLTTDSLSEKDLTVEKKLGLSGLFAMEPMKKKRGPLSRLRKLLLPGKSQGS